jgi:hypothetical protein
MNEAFDKQIEGMTIAYLQWFSSLGDAGLANNDPAPSSREFQDKLCCNSVRHLWYVLL